MKIQSDEPCPSQPNWEQLGTVQGLNVIATYVGVAQPYHTIRLMTAGPSGGLDDLGVMGFWDS